VLGSPISLRAILILRPFGVSQVWSWIQPESSQQARSALTASPLLAKLGNDVYRH
jgi:hypothetical protein